MRVPSVVTAASLSLFAVTSLASSLIGCGAADDGTSSEAADSTSTCGNGTRETGEQCDDGNTTNTDGCSATCQYEQTTRVNSVALQYATDDFCGANAIGAAIGDQAKSQIQSGLQSGISDGSISLLFAFEKLSDPTGENATGVVMGGLQGTPENTASSYDGTKDLDGWYKASAGALDMNRLPTASLTASFKKGVLSAGPGNLGMSLALGGPAVPVSLTNVHVAADVTAATKPTASKGATPGALASENVDPTLTTFGGLSNGGICGNITAASLAKIPVPAQLASGSTSCSQGYTTQNSMLDVFVNGCSVFFFTVINATQPDKSSNAHTYQLSASNGTTVDTCADESGNPVALKTCLADASFSTYLTFTAQRVIAK